MARVKITVIQQREKPRSKKHEAVYVGNDMIDIPLGNALQVLDAANVDYKIYGMRIRTKEPGKFITTLDQHLDSHGIDV